MIRLFLLALVFTSCKTTKIHEINMPLTTFETDSITFDKLGTVPLSYTILSGVSIVINELKPYKKQSIIIKRPTLFRVHTTYYIINPGENVSITLDENEAIIFIIKDNLERTRELAFQNVIQKLEFNLRPQPPPQTHNYSIDTVLIFEQNLKSEMAEYILHSKTLFDSLANSYQISDTFRKITNIVLENNRYSLLQAMYSTNSKVLKENNLYVQKHMELLKAYNDINDRQKLLFDGYHIVDRIAEAIINSQLRQIKTEDNLLKAIDSINKYFKNLSRDFLLTKLMYNIMYRNIPVSNKIIRYYFNSSKDYEYKSIIRNLRANKRKYAKAAKQKKDNRLIAQSDFKINTIEEVINRHRGKLILIDIWASWCLPCLEQQPYLDKLHQEFKNEKISFIYLSMDKDILQWQLKSQEIGIDPDNSFVFENFKNQSFLTTNKVETIPRYILIDKAGNIISADAPSPDNIELKKLIMQNISIEN